MPAIDRALVVADEAREHVRLAVLAAGSRSLIERLPNVGRPPNPVPERLLISTFNASVTSSSWWIRGVMSMLTPMLR